MDADDASTPLVDIEQTQARAGKLLEPGTAFMQLADKELGTVFRTDASVEDSSPEQCENVDVVIVGAGQCGLSVGYFLSRMSVRFVILEANMRIGDSWRNRWDSLRLFTPARFDSLAGMPFPARPYKFPTKDEMADYLETYARRFDLPVRLGVNVSEVIREGAGYRVTAGRFIFRARHLVVAAASYQKPRTPVFAGELNPAVFQIHSSKYQNPAQLKSGRVLLVGAGNSGAEIAIDLARTHELWLAGRHPGHIPFVYDSFLATRLVIPALFRGIFHRLLSVDTPFGRRAKPSFLGGALPLIRVKPKGLAAAGIHMTGRVAGVRNGKPVLSDGSSLDVENVIWCTGFSDGLEWLQLPAFDQSGRPDQYRGVAPNEPGLYFCGLHFQHSPSSTMVHGAARDAKRVADKIRERLVVGA